MEAFLWKFWKVPVLKMMYECNENGYGSTIVNQRREPMRMPSANVGSKPEGDDGVRLGEAY